MKKLILFIVLICALGCEADKKPSFSERMSTMLPKDSKNIKEYGNHWFSFDCVVNGKDKTFFARLNPNNHGHIIVVTEISK